MVIRDEQKAMNQQDAPAVALVSGSPYINRRIRKAHSFAR